MIEPPANSPPSTPRPPLAYPAILLTSYLLLQLLLLAWSAFPAATMRGEQPLESWLFLAGGQALFVSLIWPITRPARPVWRQTALEFALLLAASMPAALAAIRWVDASGQQVLLPAGYIIAWLLAGGVAAGSRPAVRWAYHLLLTLANFGLLGLGYLWLDLLRSDPTPFWRLAPMVQAARLAEFGWPTAVPDQLASLAPLVVLLLLLAGRVAGPSAKAVVSGQ